MNSVWNHIIHPDTRKRRKYSLKRGDLLNSSSGLKLKETNFLRKNYLQKPERLIPKFHSAHRSRIKRGYCGGNYRSEQGKFPFLSRGREREYYPNSRKQKHRSYTYTAYRNRGNRFFLNNYKNTPLLINSRKKRSTYVRHDEDEEEEKQLRERMKNTTTVYSNYCYTMKNEIRMLYRKKDYQSYKIFKHLSKYNKLIKKIYDAYDSRDTSFFL